MPHGYYVIHFGNVCSTNWSDDMKQRAPSSGNTQSGIIPMKPPEPMAQGQCKLLGIVDIIYPWPAFVLKCSRKA